MIKNNYVYKKNWLFQYQCTPPLNGRSSRKEIPASGSGVAFIENARTMYTDFIKAHDGPILSCLKKL